MTDDGDDRFKPRLGRIRNRGGVRSKTYVARVLRQVSKAGGAGFGAAPASRRFTGYRIGRGNDAVRRWRAGHSFGPSYRHVIIKTRIVKLKGRGIEAARAHLRYIQRDGVTRDSNRGRLYDGRSDEADGKGFIDRAEGDRHQFRFIVSPEDACELADLKPFARDLMRAMEKDLGTRLDWVAVDHFNTAHPHTHIVLRGKDERGQDLIISRDYIAHGMRRRASELVTLELGPQTEPELRQKMARQVDQERFTDLDKALLRDASEGIVDIRRDKGHARSRFDHAMKKGRLRVLARRGLAEETAPGCWRLSSKLEETLRRAGERGDIIKSMQRGMRQAGLDAGASEYSIYDPADPRARVLTGRVIDRGLHDELNDGHYVLVDAADGRVHYVVLGPRHDMDDLPPGAVVEVAPAARDMKPSDRTIADIALRNDGLYTPAIHRARDPRASEEFIKAHVRRLEALRRENMVRRFSDGSWAIPEDFAERVAALSKRQARYPGRIATLSFLSLETQVRAGGATWLDRQLVSNELLALRGERFGAEAAAALRRRREHLVAQGLARNDGQYVRYQNNLLAALRRRELKTAGEKLAKETGRAFVEIEEGERIDGVYRRPVRLASGKFALIEKSKEFALVPWRQALESQLGKRVSGIVRGTTVSFEFGKRRGMGIG